LDADSVEVISGARAAATTAKVRYVVPGRIRAARSTTLACSIARRTDIAAAKPTKGASGRACHEVPALAAAAAAGQVRNSDVVGIREKPLAGEVAITALAAVVTRSSRARSTSARTSSAA
jgi:hypothetical protein